MIVLYIFAIIFIITPFFPATGYPHWFFRTADFVRLQSIAIQLLVLICLFIFGSIGWNFDGALMLGLIGSMGYQIEKVFPYTTLNKRRDKESESFAMVSILAVNVLQTNDRYEDLITIINNYDADLVLTMESNKAWEEGLSVIEKQYPFSVKIPMENLYGMHLYSKKELKNASTQFQVEDEVPSIYFDYPINGKDEVFFACLHPAPPSPTENDTSKEQDAELMLTGKHIRELNKPVVVCGDMNDVVWSRTTRLFKKMTKMIDPREGRGFFPTFHANYRMMRFPLDHLFISQDLYVGTMERTSYFGSDHFGMYYEIHLKTNALSSNKGDLDSEEKKEVEEKIQEGKKSASENDG